MIGVVREDGTRGGDLGVTVAGKTGPAELEVGELVSGSAEEGGSNEGRLQ